MSKNRVTFLDAVYILCPVFVFTPLGLYRGKQYYKIVDGQLFSVPPKLHRLVEKAHFIKSKGKYGKK